jgi:cardiolipin synthase
VSTVRALTACLALLTAPALAQPASPEGFWRLETTDAQGRPSGGVVRIEAGAGGALSYERRTRAELTDPVEVERGSARLEQGRLVLAAASAGGVVGSLPGAAGAGSGPVGRYDLRAGAWEGQRAGVAERLVALPRDARNHVRLFVDGEAFVALREALRGAQRSIDLQMFQWADDATGRSIGELLKERARAGVRVRVLLDGRSEFINHQVKKDSVDASERLLDELRAAGAAVIHQHRFKDGLRGALRDTRHFFGDALDRVRGRTPPERETRRFLVHDHRKVIVIDRRTGFLGGQNLADHYEHAWHDVQARVDGPGVHAMEALFVDRWVAAGGQGALEPPLAEAWDGDLPVEVLGSVPGLGDPIKARLLGEVRAARREVLGAFAFIDDDESLGAFMDAARRGVRTVLLIPSDAEQVNWLVRDAFSAVRNEVVRSGVELYELRGQMLHAKVAVFDERLGALGSHNLGAGKMAESDLLVPDARFAREMKRRLWDVDLPRSDRVQVRSLSFMEQLRARGARVLRALL